MIIPMLVRLWSIVSRKRELARIRAAWETIDDRMLRDIGVSRYEIEYADLNVTGLDPIPVRTSADRPSRHEHAQRARPIQ